MRRLVLVAATLACAALAPLASAALPRATADRPDDTPGAQVHFVYAVASDQADRALDTDGTLDASIAAIQTWLRGQTGGQGLKVDTYQGQPDITFVRLPSPDATYATDGGAVFRDLGPLLTESAKIVAVYYEGSFQSPDPRAAVCGLGGSTPFARSVVFLHDQCDFDLNASKAGSFGNLETTMIHEVVHAMGAVPSCAPHYDGTGHVNDAPNDLMAPFLDEGVPPVLDVNHDDYFHANRPGCWDLSNSRFLEGGGADLTVTFVGKGQVVGDGAGGVHFSCAATCTTSFDGGGSAVGLVALPEPGFAFLGWKGACSGTARCALTMNGSQSVTAVFGKQGSRPASQPALPSSGAHGVAVRIAIYGGGRVVSVPAGISCPGRCAGAFDPAGIVQLRALPRKGWRFQRWVGGGCIGIGPCGYHPLKAGTIGAVFVKR
jgi:hypothetical protein